MTFRLSLLFSCMLLLPSWLSGQDFEQLRRQVQAKQIEARRQIVELKELLETYEKEVSETEQRFTTLESQYQDLQRQISVRERIIEQLREEQTQIIREIELTQNDYENYEKELLRLIETYQKTVTYLYKHGRSSDLALLLTSESLNQMLVRSYYLEKFEEERQKQANRIDEAKKELKRKESELQEARQRNMQVQDETSQERDKLQLRKRQQEKTIALLKQDSKALRAKLKKTNQQINNFNTTLSALVAEEDRIRTAEEDRIKRLEEERLRRLAEASKIMDATQREREIAKYSKPIVSETASRDDLIKIEKSFIAGKGRHPWPVTGGVVSAKYGTKVHPIYKTKIENPGIEIATEARSPVKSIHDGYVLSVQPIAGYGDVVIINHGRYKSVYGNLSEVYAVKNAPIKAGDIIGLSGDENSAKGACLFFMIWEKGQNINPEQWIAKK